jgi:hypothetical protein
MSRALKTYHSDRGRSIAIDPIFNATYRAVDRSGQRDVLYAWFNPSKYFDVTGSQQPAAYRRSILARATGRQLTPPSATSIDARMRSLPGIFATMQSSSDPAVDLWSYVVVVRSLGRSTVDSLARVVGVDMARQIMPYVGSTWTFGYGGVEHLKRDYGYSNTSFEIAAAVPLASPPIDFDATLTRLIGGITTLAYARDSMPAMNAQLWIASDTTSNDTMLLARRLQPSFARVGNSMLIVATTPRLLRDAVAHFASTPTATEPRTPYAQGRMRLDSFATNASQYLRSYLLRTDRYSPDEIAKRVDPMRNAIAQYEQIEWSFVEDRGLRSGTGKLGR